MHLAGNAHVMTVIYDTLGPPYYEIGTLLEEDAGAEVLAELARLRVFYERHKSIESPDSGADAYYLSDEEAAHGE
jgi:hypothetical protein